MTTRSARSIQAITLSIEALDLAPQTGFFDVQFEADEGSRVIFQVAYRVLPLRSALQSSVERVRATVLRVEVRAAKHATFSSTEVVYADETAELQAFLSRQTVEYRWRVNHIEIEDRYIITVEATFETVVPAPVVTVTPTVIDLSSLQYQGDVMQVDMTLENHGLIQAEDVILALPPEIEPAVPFELGMLLENRGAGAAENLRITSAEPKIVQNEQGLLIDFDLIGTKLDGQVMTPSFTAGFGDVAPGQRRVAQWFMTSTLHGQFTEYEASFEHVDGLGDERVSLIKEVEIHEMIRAVLATHPGADALPDFLTNDSTVNDLAYPPVDLPDTVHLSDGSVASVVLMTHATVDGPPVVGDLEVQLTVADYPATGEFGYLRVDDPAAGQFRLVRVQRWDGTDLPPENFWQTDRTFADPDERPIYEDKLHLFDSFDYADPAPAEFGTYMLYYETGDLTPPEVLSIQQVTPDPRTTAIATLDVTFSEPIDPASFDRGDITLTLNSGANLIDSGVSIVQQSETTYRITGLSALTVEDGHYDLTVDAAGVTDVVGNTGVGDKTESWLKAEHAPFITGISGVPESLRNTPVPQIVVTFSEPINLSTFTAEDLRLTRDGAAVLIAGASIAQTGAASYTVSGLSTPTTAEGGYVLTADATGVADLDGLPGQGSSAVAWTMDTTGPGVSSAVLLKDADSTIVHTVTVQFTEDIDPASFSLADLTLTRDGGSNLIDPASVAIVQHSGLVYRIQGLEQVASNDGTYQLEINQGGVADPLGNPGVGQYLVDWTVDETAPEPPSSITMTPDNGISATDLVSNVLAVTLSGAVGETGLQVSLYDVTAAVDFGDATVTGTDFTHDVTFVGVGMHKLRVRVTDPAGNYAESFFDVFVDILPPKIERYENLPAGPVENIDYIDVVLSESVPVSASNNDSAFDPGDVLLKHDGVDVPGPLGVSLTHLGGRTYRIGSLAALTAAPGVYELGVDMGGVADPAGNAGTGTTWSGPWEIVAAASDTVPPISQVDPLPAVATRLSWIVSVTGSDPDTAPGVPGSGVASYDLYVSEDLAPFAFWTSVTADDPRATFTGEGGHEYAFYSIARDVAGNVEDPPQTADATISVPDFGLTCGPPLEGSPAHVLQQCSGSVGDAPQTIVFQISLPEYNLAGGVTRLGFHVSSTSGWNPAAVAIFDASGNPVPTLLASTDVVGDEASLVLAELGYGSYTVSVSGEGLVPGEVTLSIYLVGDGDGNGVVELADLVALRSVLGAQAGDEHYRVEWDADLDGDLDTVDYLQARYNLNDSVQLFQPLMLAAGPASSGAAPSELSPSQVQPLLAAAVSQFALAGASASQLHLLSHVHVHVADLRGGTLGLARGNSIWLDYNAGGHGWQFGQSSAVSTQSEWNHRAAAQVDLLTVIGHELGHVLGWADVSPGTHPHSLMTATLAPGQQRVFGMFGDRSTSDALASGRDRYSAHRLAFVDALFADDSPLDKYDWNLRDRLETGNVHDELFAELNVWADAAPGVPGDRLRPVRKFAAARVETGEEYPQWLEALQQTASDSLDELIDILVRDY